ncbi:unnamed protein product, partial [Cylicostephanus goldi]
MTLRNEIVRNEKIRTNLFALLVILVLVRGLYIQVQETPNPLTLKFLPGKAILDKPRTYEFTTVVSAKDSPLAMELFRVDGVKSVFFGEDFVTITKKDEEIDWGTIRPEVFSTIANYI